MKPNTLVPVGLATKLGAVGTALLSAAAVLAPLLDNVGADTSRLFVTLATVLLAVTVLGRMLQAAALALSTGSELLTRGEYTTSVEDDTLHPSLLDVEVGPTPTRDEGNLT